MVCELVDSENILVTTTNGNFYSNNFYIPIDAGKISEKVYNNKIDLLVYRQTLSSI